MVEIGRGPLTGYKVLEVATMVSGPLACQMLADLGAEVIKVEPLGGDPLRMVGPSHKGMTAMFMANNRHKKSVEIDLKSERGQAAVQRLAAECDVFVQNSRPGAMDRLGLSYDILKKDNPGLIYVSISGFGPDGPYVKRQAFDQVIQALSGVMHLQNPDGEPEAINTPIVDKYCAAMAAHAATVALLHRERTGEGQFISVSLMDTFASFILNDNLRNEMFPNIDNPKPAVNINHPIRTSDGLLFGHVQTLDQMRQLCAIFDRMDLLEDPRFSNDRERTGNLRAFWAEVEKSSQNMTMAEVMEQVEKTGVALGAVHGISEFLDDPQVRHNGTIAEFEDEMFGPVRVVDYPIKFSRSPANVRVRAPILGEHNDELGLV